MAEETIPLTFWITVFVILVICLFHENDRGVDPWGRDRETVSIRHEEKARHAILVIEPTPTPEVRQAMRLEKPVKTDDWWDIVNKTTYE